MGIIFNLFVLSIGSIFGSIYLNKRYEEMMPMNLMIIIFTLFIFYMLNIPLIGYYLIHLVSYILLIISLIKFYKEKEKRKEYLKNLFTPGMLIFGIVAFLIYLVTKDNYVMLFDELRMWALYPKSIFITDNLMLGNDLFFSSEYYPGMPLFQYFFAKNIGYFSENHLFLSYGIAMLSLIIPITKKIKWKDYWAIISFIILMFTFPMLFANSGDDLSYYYKALFIDPALGIAFGYSLFLSTKDLKKDKFLYILFCLSISMVIMMKIVGIVLAACIILSYLIHQLYIHKSYKSQLIIKKTNIPNYIKLLLPLVFLIVTFFSWQIVVGNKLDFVENNTQSLTKDRIKDVVQLFVNPTKEQKVFLKTYIDTIETKPLINSNGYLSSKTTVPNIVILYTIIMILLFFCVNKNYKKIIVTSLIFGFISILALLSFYYYIYFFTFNSIVLCYVRYISTVIGGISIFTLYIIFECSYNIKNKYLYYLLISCLVFLYSNNVQKVSEYDYSKETEELTESLASEVISKTSSENRYPIKLLTIYNYCDTVTYSCILQHHHLQLSLIDNHIYPLPSGLYLASEGVVPPDFYIPINNSGILSLIEQYDYILIVEDIENINSESKELLGENPKSGDIYKKNVDKDGNISINLISNN